MTDASPEAERSVFRLFYRSTTAIAPENRAAELEEIFEESRRKNTDRGLSGALLVWEDTFVQVLEGDEATVRDLYATIAADPRHEHVVLLDAVTAAPRVFGQWSMAHVSDDDRADLPAARGDEASDTVHATPRLADERQEMVLDLMREYASPDIEPL